MGGVVGKVRFLGVDYGSNRTGLALSDPVGITCRPLEVVAQTEEELLVKRIINVATEHQVGGIVVGIPRPLSGGTNRQMETVLAFVSRLERESPVSVCTWDERFTSVLAEKDLTGNEPRDAVAACYMLQSYLDTLADDPGGG